MFEGVTPAPDRVFMKRLKSVDKKLDCLFRREHERFVITYDRASGEKAAIFMVKGENGDFRQPDERDLDRLYDADCSRIGMSMESRLKQRAYASELYHRYQRQKTRENIGHMTMDSRRQLLPAFGRAHNLGKCNSTFRRIIPKSKGKVF